MTKPTIKSLQAEIDKLTKAYDLSRDQYMEQKTATSEANATVKEVRAQFDDLKERLATAEFENQRLRGYIARVQEDDVVREELVALGDPEGEVRLVPKRKHERFMAPDHRAGSAALDEDFMHQQLRRGGEPRRKPKHWVTY